MLPRNGETKMVYLNFVCEPFREGDGSISGVLAVGIEVTDQVFARQKIEEIVRQRTTELAQTNDALLKSNHELSRSNDNLQEFAYAASHDLKEPIRKIHFFGERLKITLSEKLTKEEKHSFERMEAAAKRMSSLIDDLLSYSQVSFKAESFTQVDLNELLELVLNDLDLEIEQKKATISIGKLFKIEGHHRQLQQAFQNLISNSLKYSKADVPPIITLTCHKINAQNLPSVLSGLGRICNYHACEIKDNGIGFEQKDADRIFNVFTRLHGDTNYRGTGIGLSIVRKVIENHDGIITAESVPGEGSCFKIYLPEVVAI
jgi:light-regulated signal transduction histidine kinase (bacteriophytochrome)